MKKLLLTTSILAGLSSAAFAANPTIAQWQGTRTSGHGVEFFNSGNGVTLQDASAGNVLFPSGVLVSQTQALSSSLPAKVFQVVSNVTGTASTGTVMYNEISANTDTADLSGATGAGGYIMYIGDSLGTGAIGGRTVLAGVLALSGVTAAGVGQFYVPLDGVAQSAFSAGGTTGAGNARGNLFGVFGTATLQTGAGLYWNSLGGMELDVAAQSGTGVIYKFGMKVVQRTSDVVSGSTGDYGYGLGNQASGSAVGWSVGFAFGVPEGWWPIQSTGTLIGTYAATIGGGPSMAAAHGIDFSAVTFSSDAFKSTGFLVDGSGNVTANAYKVGATAGASCPSGVTAGTVVVVSGIVTHC